MSKKSFLDAIKSPAPCSKDWNEMTGDELVRFCSSCEKNVYNLSAMPRREARKFVARNAGKVCVRYNRLPNGKVQTADTKLYKITRNTSRLAAAGIISTTLTFSAISVNSQTINSPNPEKEKTVKSQTKDYLKTSQISFTVYDSNDSVIPGAEVKLINQKTKEEFIALSDDSGITHLNFIPRGKYNVEVSVTGFKTAKQTIQINAPAEPNTKVFLEIGTFTGIVDIYWYEIPFFTAIAQDNIEAVKNLITSGFDVNTKDSNKKTALHVAVEHENLEIIRFLLEKGAKVNAKTKSKETPILMIDESFGDEESQIVEILRLLISKGADVNVQNDQKTTVLMIACYEENLEAVRILLEAGANLNLKDEDGETALQKTDSEEIKRLLISYGAKD